MTKMYIILCVYKKKILKKAKISKKMIQQANQEHINFKINPQKLNQQFQCTVCMNPINDCYITRCGHVYCKSCIEQTINRHHRCPFCNQQLKEFKDDVFKNYHFNTMKKIVEEQIRKENKKYLTNVFDKSKLNVLLDDSKNQNKLMQPIQKRIIQMFEDSLLKYRKYMVEVYTLSKQVQQKKLIYGAKLAKTHNQLIQQLQQLVLSKLVNPIMTPQLISMPTVVQLSLSSTKSHKTSLFLCPLSQFSSILPSIQSLCSQQNVRLEGKLPNEFLINGEKRHIDQRIGMLVGKGFKVEGIPVQKNAYCFTHNWEQGKRANFYQCKTCAVKWICEACVEMCHIKHQTVIQLKDHKPEWAICYCVTKCDCKAINKSSASKIK